MLFNRDGKVFVGKRIDQTVEGWQMPQGGIDKGEEPAPGGAARTEGRSRHRQGRDHRARWTTGSPMICRAHLVGVAFHGKYRGQRQKWFALRFTGEDGDIDLTPHEPEFSAWKWVAWRSCRALIVPFKRDTYAKVIAAFRHLAE